MNATAENVTENLSEVPENETKKTVDDLPARQYFSSGNLESGSIAINEAVELFAAAKLPTQFNFDPEQEFPAGYGVGIIVNSERVEKRGNVVTDCIIAAIPEPETVASDKAGADWSRNAIISALLTKLASTARAMKRDGSSITALPISVADFITSNRGAGETLGTFNAMAGLYVKELKKKGLTYMSKALFRSTLQSKEFAEQQFPRIPQTVWESILDAMVKRAEAGIEIDKVVTKLNPAILTHWRQTRDSVEMPTLDLDALADIGGLE